MLYISRRVCADLRSQGGSYNDMGYGVVDTDDDSETVTTFENIESACLDSHLDIKGVVYLQCQDGTYQVSSIMPYMPRQNLKPVNAKSQMLNWVDVKVYKNTVVDIGFNRKVFRRDSSVRLSDFAEYVGDFLLYESVAEGSLTCTLIFDDKLRVISHTAFALLPGSTDVIASGYEHEGGWPAIGVKFDLRELTNRDLLWEMYSQIFSCRNAMQVTIDDEKRKMSMAKKFGYL